MIFPLRHILEIFKRAPATASTNPKYVHPTGSSFQPGYSSSSTKRFSFMTHRKIIRNIFEKCRPCLGNLYGDFMEKICLKAPGNYSAPIWSYKCSICLWEKPETLMSMISGFSNVSPGAKTNYFHLWRHQDT